MKRLLLNLGKHGPSNLNAEDKAIGMVLMTRYGMKMKDVSDLYGKYVGNWGGEATVWRFDGKKDGKVIASATRCPGQDLHLEVKVSSLCLREGDRYDMAAVRIRVLDEHDCLAPYAQLALSLQTEGAVEIAGPKLVCAEGGSTGCYVKTTGKTGEGILHICCGQCEPVTLRFTVEDGEAHAVSL